MDSSLDGVVGKGGGICAKNGPLSADARGESRERRAKCKGPEAGTSSGTESQHSTSVIRI